MIYQCIYNCAGSLLINSQRLSLTIDKLCQAAQQKHVCLKRRTRPSGVLGSARQMHGKGAECNVRKTDKGNKVFQSPEALACCHER